ncbi:hypothetical protein K8I31_15780, partial [bacterium]|nr:hypothetical protein [bacterium]
MKHFKPRQFNGFLSPRLLRFWLPWSVFLLLFAAVRIAPPDLAFYYSFGHSFLYDTNFYFAPQFAHFDFAPHELYLSAQGLPANDWPMGTGILWTPFLFLAFILRTVLNFAGFPIESGGYNWFDQWVVTFGASLVYGAGTVYASYRLVLSQGAKRSTALWSCALIAAGSSLTYHLYVNSADSHPPSAFFIVLSLLAWQSYKKAPSAAIALMGGAALGLAGLVRPHNLIWGLTPFIDWIIHRKTDERTKFNLTHAAVFVASAILA